MKPGDVVTIKEVDNFSLLPDYVSGMTATVLKKRQFKELARQRRLNAYNVVANGSVWLFYEHELTKLEV